MSRESVQPADAGGERAKRPDGEVDNRREQRKARAIAVLAANGQYRDAAEAAGVDRRTIGRWMREPSFRRRTHEARTEHTFRIYGELSAAAPTAVEVLRSLTEDESVDPGHRIRAADALIRHQAKLHQLSALKSELDELRVEVERLDGEATSS